MSMKKRAFMIAENALVAQTAAAMAGWRRVPRPDLLWKIVDDAAQVWEVKYVASENAVRGYPIGTPLYVAPGGYDRLRKWSELTHVRFKIITMAG